MIYFIVKAKKTDYCITRITQVPMIYISKYILGTNFTLTKIFEKNNYK